MSSPSPSLFYVPLYSTDSDDALTAQKPEGSEFGQSFSGGGNGIGASVLGVYQFNPSTEIGDFSVQGLSVRNLAGGLKWGPEGLGSGASLTYSFLVEGVSQYNENEGNSAITSAFNAAQKTAAQSAMQKYANVANLTFSQVTDTTTSAGDGVSGSNSGRRARCSDDGVEVVTAPVNWPFGTPERTKIMVSRVRT